MNTAKGAWRVTAVDFSAVALAMARRLAAERGVSVEWVEADLRDCLPQAGAFDLVLVLYLQLPAAERRLVLARAASALAPGGTLLVVGHHVANRTEGWGGPKLVERRAPLPGPWVTRAGFSKYEASSLTRDHAAPRGFASILASVV